VDQSGYKTTILCKEVEHVTTSPHSHSSDSTVHVNVSVEMPNGAKRTPVDVCCVIDISGSMSTEAYVINSTGEREGHGLTSLDVVRHAVKTLANSMGPDDRIAVVVFNDNGKPSFSRFSFSVSSSCFSFRVSRFLVFQCPLFLFQDKKEWEETRKEE
jgi:von Willebrand factor type A domain